MKKYLDIKKSHKEDKDRRHKPTQKDSKRKQKKNIEEMRKERLQREAKEHERERKLLASVRGDREAATETSHYDAPNR